VNRKVAFESIIVSADVIQAEDVVRVGVREQDGVDPGDVGANDLETELRRRVD
jgi:hypothetical protein